MWFLPRINYWLNASFWLVGLEPGLLLLVGFYTWGKEAEIKEFLQEVYKRYSLTGSFTGGGESRWAFPPSRICKSYGFPGEGGLSTPGKLEKVGPLPLVKPLSTPWNQVRVKSTGITFKEMWIYFLIFPLYSIQYFVMLNLGLSKFN